MKKGFWQRTGACILSFALLAACLTAGGVMADLADEDTTTPEAPVDPYAGFSQIAETEQARLCFDEETHLFYVENKATGYRWHSAPTDMAELEINDYMQIVMSSMLDVEYYDYELETEAMVSSLDNAASYGNVTYETVDGGIVATFYFEDIDLTVPLQLILEEDHLTASVDVRAMKYDPKRITVLQMHILPYFGAISCANEQGYAMLPDGSGALIYATGSKENAPKYQKPVYGKDITISKTDEDGITMPVFGVSDGQNALLAVITEDAEDAYINCESNGQATMYAHPWASFKTMVDFEYALVSDYYSTLVFEEGEIKADKLEVKYYPISGDRGGYAEMAAKYRELLFGEELLEAAKVEPALFLDLYASVRKVRSILGFKSEYDDIVTSTKDVETILKALQEGGVDSTVVRYNAWNKQENAGYVPTKMKWGGSVGNVADMIEDMKAFNSAVYPALSRVSAYEKSWNPLHTMNNITRDPASRVIMSDDRYLTTSRTGTSYLLNYANLDKNLSKLLTNADKKMSSLALGDVGNLLYSDFSDGSSKRPAFAEMVAKHLADFKKDNGLLLDNPNLYAAVYADEIINLPTASSGHMILDEDVPFVQMVYSGVIRHATTPVNLSGSPKAAFLKALEYGSMPCYAWIGSDGSSLINTELDYLFSADYKFWLDEATAQYAVLKELAEKAEGSVMVSHKQLTDGVFATEYENGATVIVNYNDEPYKAGGVSVPGVGYLIQDRG